MLEREEVRYQQAEEKRVAEERDSKLQGFGTEILK
jgi:hypothetical protein